MVVSVFSVIKYTLFFMPAKLLLILNAGKQTRLEAFHHGFEIQFSMRLGAQFKTQNSKLLTLRRFRRRRYLHS